MLDHRLQKLVCFDRLQIVVAESDPRARIELRVKRMLWAAYNPSVAVMCSVAVGQKHCQLIHPLEVPTQRPLCPFNLERELAFVALNHAANLQRALHPIREFHQGARIVLVGDISAALSCCYAEMRPQSWSRQWPLRKERLSVSDYPVNGARQHHPHI